MRFASPVQAHRSLAERGSPNATLIGRVHSIPHTNIPLLVRHARVISTRASVQLLLPLAALDVGGNVGARGHESVPLVQEGEGGEDGRVETSDGVDDIVEVVLGEGGLLGEEGGEVESREGRARRERGKGKSVSGLK